MSINQHFLLKTLDTVKQHIAVVNENFDIQYVNKSWIEFGQCNGIGSDQNWLGTNYIRAIESAAFDGDEFASSALLYFGKLRDGHLTEFEIEYPCHSKTQDRWFSMQVIRFLSDDQLYFVISHSNITKRVQLEIESKRLARVDALTGIANRRGFDEFLDLEWKRCSRDQFPISLAIIDVDDFKQINDKHGHLFGDECLQKIASMLMKHSGRSSDLCARIGGDEFAILWGNVDKQQADNLSAAVHLDISKLRLYTENSELLNGIDVSIGVHTVNPRDFDKKDLISFADKLMFDAKQNGKNKVHFN